MSERSMGRSAALVSAATMLSRLLGLLREQAFAALFGAGHVSDAFKVAFRIPNLLRDLFAEGALSSAFVPVFTKTLRRDGQGAAYELGNTVFGTLAAVSFLLIALGLFFAPELVTLMAGAYADTPGKLDLTVLLTRVMLPFLFFISMAAVAMGMLNSQERFVAPAIAPALFNVVAVLAGLLLWATQAGGKTLALGWAIAVLLGGAVQLLVQLPPLWRLGWRPRLRLDLRLRGEGMHRIAWTMAPAVLSVAAVQVNVFVNTSFASQEPGAVSWLEFAFRFLQLPIGVFGVAIATVATARFAAAAADADLPRLAANAQSGLRLVLFLTVPSTIGLVLLDEPIIRLIYEHGRFLASDTAATALALRYYAVGLVAYAAVKVLAPAFYAVGTPRFAVMASLAAVAGNIAVNSLLYQAYGYKVLALGTAIAALLNVAILYVFFCRRIAGLRHRELAAYAVKILAMAAVMGATALGSYYVLDAALGGAKLWHQLLEVLLPVALGGLTYGVLAAIFKVPEFEQITARLRRRGAA